MCNSAKGLKPRVVEYGFCSQKDTTIYRRERTGFESELRSVNNLEINIGTLELPIAWENAGYDFSSEMSQV